MFKAKPWYRSVVNNLKEVVFQTDIKGCWSFLNPSWMEITGFDFEETLGKPMVDFSSTRMTARGTQNNSIRWSEREKDHCR